MTTIISIGHLAGEIRCTVSTIKSVAKRLGIAPSHEIDGVAHFNADDAAMISETIRTGGEKKDA